MKNSLLVFLLFSFIISSCTSGESKKETSAPVFEYTVYGESFEPEKIMTATDLLSFVPKSDTDLIVFIGLAQQVCEKKGCWVDVVLNDTVTMKMRFKDYSFFVPMTLEGDTIIAKGFLYRDTLSVEELKHYAKDEGLPDSEINKITLPEYSYLFEASGLLVKK